MTVTVSFLGNYVLRSVTGLGAGCMTPKHYLR